MIEPSTGEILVLLSSPAYDPNVLTGRERGTVYRKLSTHSLKPLYNRAIMAQYPPGSPFKPFLALIALQEGVIRPTYTYTCRGSYKMTGVEVNCLSPGTFNLHRAIQHSCNSYFINLYRKVIDQRKYKNTAESFQKFIDYLKTFGFGNVLGIDLPSEVKGILPSTDMYDKMYGAGRWRSSTTLSLGIGQGEFGFTPVQIANGVSVIANQGYYHIPHVVRGVGTRDTLRQDYKEKHFAAIDPKYFPIIVDAMEDVVERGTARIARLQNISFCGKTGSVENPHGKDHSLFTGFAPKDKPRVVVVVIVENSGFGATYAAPIASLLVEKYLTDSIADSRKWLEKKLMEIDLL